jgi:hypothetical protein
MQFDPTAGVALLSVSIALSEDIGVGHGDATEC